MEQAAEKQERLVSAERSADRSKIDVDSLFEDDRIAKARLVAIKQAASTAVARVNKLAVPRVVIIPPIVLPPPMPKAPPSLL